MPPITLDRQDDQNVIWLRRGFTACLPIQKQQRLEDSGFDLIETMDGVSALRKMVILKLLGLIHRQTPLPMMYLPSILAIAIGIFPDALMHLLT
jgi:hypothetical protein